MPIAIAPRRRSYSGFVALRALPEMNKVKVYE
jgi:hypothetical protein